MTPKHPYCSGPCAQGHQPCVCTTGRVRPIPTRPSLLERWRRWRRARQVREELAGLRDDLATVQAKYMRAFHHEHFATEAAEIVEARANARGRWAERTRIAKRIFQLEVELASLTEGKP